MRMGMSCLVWGFLFRTVDGVVDDLSQVNR